MEGFTAEQPNRELLLSEIETVAKNTLAAYSTAKRVLLIHPDYSRHDYSHVLVPCIYRLLAEGGLVRLDTLNAGGTHRPMSEAEILTKLGLTGGGFPKLGTCFNHEFDNSSQLYTAVEIPASFVKEKTRGHLDIPLPVTVNKLLRDNYDLIIAVSGTVPHEAIGYSGGTKIFFPGISGPEVIGLLHWAAVLIGIPDIIGCLDNAAREVVDEGTKHIFNSIPDTPVVSFNMVYQEDDAHRVLAKGLYTGEGLSGFSAALKQAAALSSKLHIRYLDEEKSVVVQRLPEMYDEVWTAGKGSYKLQKPGVLAPGGEIILFAPHIHCFHSNSTMDREIREIGYHGRDYVVDFCKRNPEFSKNVASHVINVRGLGSMVEGKEQFPFKVTLATQIPEADCTKVGLGYRDPESLREEDFSGPGKLWIPDGGQWLYARQSES